MDIEMGSSNLFPAEIPVGSLHAHLPFEAGKIIRPLFDGTHDRRLLMLVDDLDFANFLATELQEHKLQIDLMYDPEEASAALQRKGGYDLLILDCNPAQPRGTSLLHSVRLKFPRLPILVLTARNSVEEKVCALEGGADDCLAKPLALAELLARVHALLRRNLGAVPNCSRVGDLLLYREERRVERNGRRIDLTPREFAILDVLMRNAGRPVSRATLLSEVWNMSGQPATNIVDVYMKYVRDKVDSPGEPRLTHTVRGFGYELREV